MAEEGKSKRLRERLTIALPMRVQCRESPTHEWMELTHLIDVTPFGARFSTQHPMEVGRLLYLTIPLPRQLRCFDHAEDQYRVWCIVRRVVRVPNQKKTKEGGEWRYEIGTAFIGKQPPPSYKLDPTMRYDIAGLSGEQLFEVREPEKRSVRTDETRLTMPLDVTIESFNERGEVAEREQTVTENVSRRGAAVYTSLNIERGRFVRVTSLRHNMSITAVVRARRIGENRIARLHLEFVGEQLPLEGIE